MAIINDVELLMDSVDGLGELGIAPSRASQLLTNDIMEEIVTAMYSAQSHILMEIAQKEENVQNKS